VRADPVSSMVKGGWESRLRRPDSAPPYQGLDRGEGLLNNTASLVPLTRQNDFHCKSLAAPEISYSPLFSRFVIGLLQPRQKLLVHFARLGQAHTMADHGIETARGFQSLTGLR